MTGTNISLQAEFGTNFKDKRVLVTGARGFIGGHLVRALSELGATVYAGARAWPSVCDISRNFSHPGDGLQSGDISHPGGDISHSGGDISHSDQISQSGNILQMSEIQRNLLHPSSVNEKGLQPASLNHANGGAVGPADDRAKDRAKDRAMDRATNRTNDRANDRAYILAEGHVGRVIPVAFDLTDYAATKEAISLCNPEIIFHLASTVTAQESIELVAPTLNNIVVGTVNLLTAAVHSHCKEVLTCSTPEEPANTDVAPASPYGAAKKCCSIYYDLFRQKYNLTIKVIRPYLTFGPGQPETKLIPHAILKFINNQKPQLSDGSRTFDIIYVDDVVRGILLTAESPHEARDFIDLGSGTAIQMREVVSRLQSLIGAPIAAEYGKADARTSNTGVADLNRSYELIGWRPVWQLDDALRETIAYYRNAFCKNRMP